MDSVFGGGVLVEEHHDAASVGEDGEGTGRFDELGGVPIHGESELLEN